MLRSMSGFVGHQDQTRFQIISRSSATFGCAQRLWRIWSREGGLDPLALNLKAIKSSKGVPSRTRRARRRPASYPPGLWCRLLSWQSRP
jgi:hypothetical protein